MLRFEKRGISSTKLWRQDAYIPVSENIRPKASEPLPGQKDKPDESPSTMTESLKEEPWIREHYAESIEFRLRKHYAKGLIKKHASTKSPGQGYDQLHLSLKDGKSISMVYTTLKSRRGQRESTIGNARGSVSAKREGDANKASSGDFFGKAIDKARPRSGELREVEIAESTKTTDFSKSVLGLIQDEMKSFDFASSQKKFERTLQVQRGSNTSTISRRNFSSFTVGISDTL